MPIDLDMSVGEEESQFQPLPEAVYTYRIKSVEVKDNKEKTGQYLNFQMQVLDEGEFKNRVVFHIVSLLPSSRFFLRKFLETVTGEDWQQDGMKLEPKDLVGLSFKGITVQEPYTNPQTQVTKINNKIREVLPPEPTEFNGYKSL